MKELFKKEELPLLSVNFILSMPETTEAIATGGAETVMIAKPEDEQRSPSPYHQNKGRLVIGGFYKSITRIIK